MLQVVAHMSPLMIEQRRTRGKHLHRVRHAPEHFGDVAVNGGDLATGFFGVNGFDQWHGCAPLVLWLIKGVTGPGGWQKTGPLRYIPTVWYVLMRKKSSNGPSLADLRRNPRVASGTGGTPWPTAGSWRCRCSPHRP